MAEVKHAYSVIKKVMPMGGAAGGPIYGELTQASMAKALTKMGVDSGSVFMDIGSGVGKPSIHAVTFGAQISIGLEIVGERWRQSMMVLRALLEDPEFEGADRLQFFHSDFVNLESFDPVTHLYSFNRAMNPTEMKRFADIWNASNTTKVLVVYHNPKKVIGDFGFESIEFSEKFTVSMAGSGQKHTAYMYVRPGVKTYFDGLFVPPTGEFSYSRPRSYAKFSEAFGNSEKYLEWVDEQAEKSHSGSRKRLKRSK